MKKKIISILALVLLTIAITGCAISAEDYSALETEIAQLTTERDSLNSTLQDLQQIYPLKGFATVTEFKDWIYLHVQPESQYMEDAFLSAVKVQEAAEADGYLMGISLDVSSWLLGEEALVGVTTFVGNELYWWFVEEVDMYYPLDLKR